MHRPAQGSNSPTCYLYKWKLFLDVDFCFSFDLADAKFCLEFLDGYPQRIVDRNFLAYDIECHGQCITGSVVGVFAPTLVPAHGNAEILGQRV